MRIQDKFQERESEEKHIAPGDGTMPKLIEVDELREICGKIMNIEF